MGLKAIISRVAGSSSGIQARVGLNESEANQVHPLRDDGMTVGEVAALQEFGSRDGHIPARPFLRSTLMWNRGIQRELKGVLAQVSRMVIFQGVSQLVAMRHAGAWGARKVSEAIRAGIKPDNADRTVREKGHDMTLRHTMTLLAAISYDVVKRGRIAFVEGDEE